MLEFDIAAGRQAAFRRMRRLALISLVLALTAAAPAHAGVSRYLSASGDWLGLYRGTGVARLVSGDGVAWGKMGLGRLTVADVADAGGTEIHVWGYERTVVIDSRTTAYVNTRELMTFEIVDGRWRATIRGRGINASVVMTGRAARSYGRSGRYSVNSGPRRPWPWRPKVLILG